MTDDRYTLQPEDIDLIRAVLAANCPTPFEVPDRIESLTRAEISSMDVALARELAGRGFTESDEPTEYGHVIEWILDRLKYIACVNVDTKSDSI